jgi:catechol 2,3-dioxygenase-like lactoylglutathione lyase family enzyme
MKSQVMAALLVVASGAPPVATGAQTRRGTEMSTARVRYMVNELDPAVAFYTRYLGFRIERQVRPNFAILSRGPLELVLSTPYGPGGAAKPMLDGRRAEPGGWNRIIIEVADIRSEAARLRERRVHFRSDILTGPGGSEVVIDDPSGNAVELFQPAG